MIIAQIINLLYYVLVILIFARVILSFTNVSPYHPIRRTVDDLTEPILAPIRQILPPAGGLDFSPFVVLIAAQLLRIVLLSALRG